MTDKIELIAEYLAKYIGYTNLGKGLRIEKVEFESLKPTNWCPNCNGTGIEPVKKE
jgi:hypothetical protein